MYDDQGADLKNSRRLRKADDFDFDPMFTDQPAPAKLNDLDNEKNSALHARLMAFYTQELTRQEANRKEQAEDEDFYDNIQWSAEDKATMEERGQIPLVYNVISNAVDWVLGTERRMRTDFKVLPRRKDGGPQAQLKTQLLKYLADVNSTGYDVSRAFADAVKTGLGWVEDGVQNDEDGEPVYSRYESWRNILADSASIERDLSDARYVFRQKWVDEDIAIAMFPARKGTIQSSVDSGARIGLEDDGDEPMDALEESLDSVQDGIYDAQHLRRRVRLIECWYRTPVKAKRLRGGDFSGEIFDQGSAGHNADVNEGRATIIEATVYRMHVAIMTTEALLFASESPYRHNQFPFTPVWGKVRGRDNQPYGMIRGMKDIQVDINKRAAKALHILSTNKILMQQGAVEDIDEFAEENARPDSILVVKDINQIKMGADRELAPAHLDLMARSIQMVQTQSGVTDENMGRQSNATSGKAIQARQDQGSLATSNYFDNLRFARQLQGAKQLSLIEQYFTDEKQFRITNQRGRPDYITVNDGLPENDVTRTKADFIISEEDWNITRRQAEVQELMALLGQIAPVAPQLALVMLDLIVEGMDVANREELVKRIRQVTGMRDPDAEEPTPEEIQQQQAAAQQAELQQRAQMADIADKEARAVKAQADAKRAEAGAQQILANMAGVNVATQRTALETALMMLQAAPAVPVADSVLHEAGFSSRTEQEQVAQERAMAEAQQQQALEQEQAQLQAQQQQAQQPAGPDQLPQ